MDGYARTEDELFSACLLNLTWENCYEQVGQERKRHWQYCGLSMSMR